MCVQTWMCNSQYQPGAGQQLQMHKCHVPAAGSQGQLPGSEGLSPATAEIHLGWTHIINPSSKPHPQPQRGLDKAVWCCVCVGVPGACWSISSCWAWNHGAAPVWPFSGCWESMKYFPLTNTITIKLLFIHIWVTGLKGWGGRGKRKKKKEKDNTHLCINFPGASFTRTPFSIGLPSFADGLFVSERVKKYN